VDAFHDEAGMKTLKAALSGLLVALLMTSGVASAQQEGRVYKIGWLWVGAPSQLQLPFEQWTGSWAAIREVLHENGFVTGKNLSVDVRNANGDIGQLQGLAAALVASNVDVLVTPGTPATLAAMQVTKSIPIVFPGIGKPIEKGIVASFAKPGGNVTGMAVNIENAQIWNLLKEIAPTTRLVGGLSNARNQEGMAPDRLKAYRAGVDEENKTLAASLGFDYVAIRVSDLGEIASALEGFAKSGGDALYVNTDATLWTWRTSIMESARRHRLLSACQQDFQWAQEGCVITYGEAPREMRRGAAMQIVRVLRGVKPADIPVERPHRFRLIVNAKSAKALGFTVPKSVLTFADEVIE
jgi:putative ABC transport system substrate-binding protein